MSKSVSFAEGTAGTSTSTHPGSGAQMDPVLARRLFESGATLVMLDFPVGTEFGIDMNVWNTGEKFKGVKMIPPGVHFVHFSAVSKEGQTAPRTGFFHDFSKEELVAKRYVPQDEDIEDISETDKERMRADLKNLDPYLGAYPYDSWKKWVSLTNRISNATISRLEPMTGKIRSVTELVPESHLTSRSNPSKSASEAKPCTSGNKRASESEREDEKLPKMNLRPGTAIRYTPLPTAKYPEGSTPAQITQHSMDSSFQLDTFLGNFKRMYGDQVSSSMAHLNELDEVLAELQFCFVCFLVGQHYDSFEHWKRLLALLCSCDEAMSRYTDLYMTLISDLHFQIREVPDDFFVDIVSSNNFLVSVLSQFFANINSNDSIDSKLKQRAVKFQTNLSKKFNWDFTQDLDDDQPVVVDLS